MQKAEIRLLQRAALDERRWQDALQAGKGSHVYARTWYLDVVAKDWKALVYGDYEAVMPLTCGKKYGISYLYQPFFTQQLGVFGKAGQDAKVQSAMIAEAARLYPYAEINLHDASVVEGIAFPLKQRTNYVLPLQPGIEALRKRYADTLKRNIKKAQKQGFSVMEVEDGTMFLRGYMNHTAMKTKEIKASHKPMLKELLMSAVLHGAGMIYGVYDGEECVAACFYLLDEERCVALMPWAAEQGRKHGAAAMLADAVIEKMCGVLPVFDFEGSDIPGVAGFYKQFSPELKPYQALKWNLLPAPIKWLKK